MILRLNNKIIHMNKFEESEVLSELNKRIKSEAFDSTCDYKPFDDNLDPREYAEYGYVKGQQELLENMIEKGIITVYDLKKLL